MALVSNALAAISAQIPGGLNLDGDGDGFVDHITFDVDDIDTTFNLLKQASFNVIEQAPVFLPFWKNGCKYFNILGPDGERLEFNQLL